MIRAFMYLCQYYTNKVSMQADHFHQMFILSYQMNMVHPFGQMPDRQGNLVIHKCNFRLADNLSCVIGDLHGHARCGIYRRLQANMIGSRIRIDLP